jgi:hypothetical protein
MLHTQEVIGSRPVGPIYSYNNLGGAEWPAFFYVHTNVHTAATWSFPLRLYNPPVNSCRNRFSAGMTEMYCGCGF